MIAERQDEAVGVDTGFEPRMMGALRMAWACRLLVAAAVMWAVAAACDSPGPDGADSAPRVTEAPASGAPAPVATTQPTVVATATPARPVAQAFPTATAAAVETRVPRALVRTPTPAETAVPSPSPTPTPAATAAPSPSPTPAASEQQTPTPAGTAAPTLEALAEELRGIVQEEIRQEFPEFPGVETQPVHVIPLGLPVVTGVYWWVVTDGPQPAKLTSEGEVDNFFHFAAVYRRSEGGEWSEVDRLEIESAPQRTQVEVLTAGWEAPGGEPSAWIAVRGGTGAHAGTLDVIGFDGAALGTSLSRITQRQYLSEFLDLDGDGLLEVVLNDSDPYIFCFTCATELQRVVLYRWTGAQLARVELGTPPDQSDDQIERAVALAKADLWREAAAAAVDASRAFPESAEVRWLSILINWTAVARLNYGGASGQPLLTLVFAGEYAAAADLMRGLAPAQAFALDGPLIAGTAAEQDLSTMAVQLLDYTERALAVAPERADIHAVRALGLALASPADLSGARSALAQAATLAPDDAFFQASRDFLDSVERAPGAPLEPPDQRLALLEGPSASFFAEGYTLGSGDRGRNVKAVQQRLARIPGLDFVDPGRYFDVYHEPTRKAVVAFQLAQELEPNGVVDAATWEALEAAHQAALDSSQATPAPRTAGTELPRPADRRYYSHVALPPLPAVRIEPQSQPAADAAAQQPAHAEAGQSVVYLTFDDGPHPSFTTPIVEILAGYAAPATFFSLGAQIAKYPDLTATLATNGHSLQNHTYSHPALNRISREAYVDEVTRADAAIQAAVGDAALPTSCLRPPYGAIDNSTASIAAELGKSIVMWDVDPQDWRQPGAGQIARHILSHAYPGAIILMHDGGGGRSQTVAALRTVLAELAARSFTFRIVPACDPAG